MRLLSRFGQGELPLGRIEAFSDGVFAIVGTLLVLEFSVPVLHNPRSAEELGHRLLDLLPAFLSWMISFIIVCKFWLNHHHILGLARCADYGMVWLNSIFLMFQSFIPFPTALMGQYPSNPLAVAMFGVIMAFNTLLFMILHRYIIRNLIKPELVSSVDPYIIWKSFAGPLSYLAGAAAAWLSVHTAFFIYFLTPLFFITPPRAPRAVQAEAAPETLQSASP
jgi:TMEM175 potassium channel family protein